MLLKRGEAVEITYHGQTLGIVQPVKPPVTTKEQENAMASFFAMHRDLTIDSVEEELRTIRQGRLSSLCDLFNFFPQSSTIESLNKN